MANAGADQYTFHVEAEKLSKGHMTIMWMSGD